jgi:hypothetical protein
MTVVSVVARCDKSSNEHSETAAFLGGGRAINRVLRGAPSHLTEVVCFLFIIQSSTHFGRSHHPNFVKGLPYIAIPLTVMECPMSGSAAALALDTLDGLQQSVILEGFP